MGYKFPSNYIPHDNTPGPGTYRNTKNTFLKLIHSILI